MNGFVASPQPPVTPDGVTVSLGEFWPSIDVNAFRDAMRIGGQAIPDPRVIAALEGALIIVDDNLANWAAEQIEAGHAALADVPSAAMGGGLTRLQALHRRAVYGFAAADLIETHRDLTATKAGATDADRPNLTPDDHRRNAIHAIRAMAGKTRTSVALI